MPKLQNQATHSLPPPNGHLQADLRKKRCSILSKLKERNAWRAALASNERLIPKKSEDAIHRAMHISRITPVSYLTSPSCPLSAKSISLPLSELFFWKKQRERQKSLKLSLELESKTGSYLKYKILNSQSYRGGESLIHWLETACCTETACNIVLQQPLTLSYSLLIRCM